MYFVVSIHNYTTKEVECQGGAYFFLFFPNAEIIVAEGGGSSRFAPGERNDCGKFSGQIFHPVSGQRDVLIALQVNCGGILQHEVPDGTRFEPVER